MTADPVGGESLDPRTLRRAQPLNEALPLTIKWVAALPQHIRPYSLLREFPRIANVLARSWRDEPTFAAYMASLIYDRRGSRKGFPPTIRSELLVLRDFFSARYTNVNALDVREAATDMDEQIT